MVSEFFNLVLTAVKQNQDALQFVSNELSVDEEIVRTVTMNKE